MSAKKTPEERRLTRLAAKKRYRDRYPEKIAAAARRYEIRKGRGKGHRTLTEEERIQKRRADRIARKARLKGGGGRPSRDIKEKLLIAQKGKCVYCKEKLDRAHIDHILPLALGGSSDDLNLQLLCPRCNRRKSAKHPVEFAQSLGMLL